MGRRAAMGSLAVRRLRRYHFGGMRGDAGAERVDRGNNAARKEAPSRSKGPPFGPETESSAATIASISAVTLETKLKVLVILNLLDKSGDLHHCR